jgi:hypothetical protein
MNKGTRASSGDYVWFLNAGDTCADPGVVARLLQALAEDPAIDVLCGQVWFVSRYGRRSVGGPVTHRSFLGGMPVCHQGILYRRSLLLTRLYPPEYRLISDWVVTRSLFEQGARFRSIDTPLACYNLEGSSSRQHSALVMEMLRHERTLWAQASVLLHAGTHYAAVWAARKTGLHAVYKRWQHRPPGN